MNFARWETLENMKELVPLNDGTKSGLPIAYEGDKIYIDSRNYHSIVIGTAGSGKTQAITLPMLKFACMGGESVIIRDFNDEVYNMTKDMFKENNYNIFKLNLDDAIDTNCWNPYDIVKKLYNEGNFDKATELIEEISYYLLNDVEEKNSDPFWINSTVSYFTGIILYALKEGKDVTIETIYDIDELIRENPEKFLKGLDKHSPMYINLSGVLGNAKETLASIFSIFSGKMKNIMTKENLRKMLSKSDFDISKLEKTIIYVKSGKTSISNNLFSLFVNQVYSTKLDTDRLNIIIDDFYTLNPIKNFPRVLNYSVNMGISFTIMIRGFNDLKTVYGKEETEMIKLGFTNIVYLLSQDMETLEEISRMCGNKSQTTPLISIEELKTLDMFEAIILTTRMMPFRTKLLPYYKMK